MDSETARELELLAGAASATADGFRPDRVVAAEREYEQLRRDAANLNAVHGWAMREEFETMFPALRTQRQIEILDAQIGVGRRGSEHAVQGLLRNLAAWTAGVSLAGITLSDGQRRAQRNDAARDASTEGTGRRRLGP